MTIAIKRSTLMIDAALLAGACLIPAASHLFALPLYHLDPMRWLLLASLLVGAHHGAMKTNGLLMAVLLPLVSCMIVGMPTFPKAMLMVAELTTNVAIFALLAPKVTGFFQTMSAMAASILGAKIVYYSLKVLLINLSVVSMPVFGASIAMQVIVLLAVSAVAALVLNKR